MRLDAVEQEREVIARVTEVFACRASSESGYEATVSMHATAVPDC